jgi:hypothetical protein
MDKSFCPEFSFYKAETCTFNCDYRLANIVFYIFNIQHVCVCATDEFN